MLMFGRWTRSIDNKWRLSLPAALGREIDNFVLIYENEEGCIRIEKPPLKVDEVADPTSIFIIEVEKGGHNGRRILIPRSLRGSTSFYYGRKVTLVGKRDYLELWPRP
ncbi:hypothetical protein COW77_00770 [Candidatus Wolfebacteria bacterium CG18_big_fil_WC_8_21_14_2_50_39_7]|uniref:SpoVT-AbrB domain-containing protein n=2 Tax=Candidatus Wolfeibacteriota TaxID=1752735 RepID=A0A2H0EEN6_9BACT|nr:hypothetical protein [Candidatus Wolfebacteria bacterium]PIP92280.1 MAG: hypothetical protein COW77_00770 [Candidatus Wolfebacteria bacterium CG18_big_fil_WC_8_21_14_2_50_39_7]